MFENKEQIKIFSYIVIVIFFSLLFVFLKINNIITWSWLWVLSPIWIPSFIIISFFVAFVVLKFLSHFLEGP